MSSLVEAMSEPSADFSDSVIELQIPSSCAGLRLDRALADLIPEQSRSTIRRWIDNGQVRLNGEVPQPRRAVDTGDLVVIDVPEPVEIELLPEQMALDIVYQDESIIVINKPPGLVVHPGAGNWSGTLANGLLGFDGSLSLSSRQIDRYYVALIDGNLIAGGTVDQPIGRDPHDRRRMTVRAGGRDSVTHYRIRQRFDVHTLVDIKLESGRTHQIRVHMKWLRFPVTGDPVYGGRPRLPRAASEKLIAQLTAFRRQALHARELKFEHPVSGVRLTFEQPVPDDMKNLVAQLQLHHRQQDSDGEGS